MGVSLGLVGIHHFCRGPQPHSSKLGLINLGSTLGMHPGTEVLGTWILFASVSSIGPVRPADPTARLTFFPSDVLMQKRLALEKRSRRGTKTVSN